MAGAISPPGSGGLQNVWRFLPDGTLGTDFHKVGGFPRRADAVGSGSGDLDIDGAGRVILAGGGIRIQPGKTVSQGYGSLHRFLPDGRLDTTFGDHGLIYQLDSGTYRVEAWQLSDVASFEDGTFVAPTYNRLTLYSSDGVALRDLAIPPNLWWANFEIDATGRLIVGGSLSSGASQFVVLRFKPNGTPDGGPFGLTEFCTHLSLRASPT